MTRLTSALAGLALALPLTVGACAEAKSCCNGRACCQHSKIAKK